MHEYIEGSLRVVYPDYVAIRELYSHHSMTFLLRSNYSAVLISWAVSNMYCFNLYLEHPVYNNLVNDTVCK